ncbi:MAG: alpha/beta hydrolase [Alphaproteobacteria bacterium]|nr:alpha/beta hydrolase [Alphaproteobacteria bacterium]
MSESAMPLSAGLQRHTGHDIVRELERAAEIFRSPCGDGNLVYLRWQPDDDEGMARAPVVLLHGGSGSWRHWLRNILYLLGQHPVIAFDMPGLGDSAKPPEPVSFQQLGAIIAQGLDRLEGAGAYHIAGFSLGSLVAPHVVLASQRKLLSLALVHGHFHGRMAYAPRQSLKRWRNVEDRNERRNILRFNLGQLMLAHPHSANDLTLDLYQGDLECSRLRVETFIATLDTDILKRISAPLLAISGALDPTGVPSPREQQELLRTSKPDAECHVIENCGHWVMWEAADEFNTLFGAWLLRQA